ncbi:bifunctional 3-(3-hydroxy-phenyl)propionate/3-hydroxycinnamic acid hydroxylase MhpA [Nocardia africana]|uniref:3-(3-hydroxy-phenyl)propionate/3-hydroxycinnamic acid hydroxylase n=1 Tax=Nocardia africana TaxID=134964 RepID=A0A378WTD6_9NOCA|nr:bifunctional 3-(3-hydroxy-phenyl)propionate/3-hydroxycinnamic acid hydroxylase [Nocardia africana]MCC3314145.1 bifunctional 3-(3-hydroxy-phenyl)propionate/3-hydroxycinnamic acid hydroxylase [Nocardia africana]SUA43603.1 3-(3-hydroxy-phenyl)propionate/3-hydroxycinnamic acid hydroxylase [Nocardia africana]
MNSPAFQVVIVGAGPTGLTAATLLAQYGIESLVLERWEGVYPQPRAVHLDGEIRRILQRLGVGDEFDAVSRPASGLRLVDSDHRVLAQFDRDPAGGRNGHSEANLFDQPELEAILRRNLSRYPEARLRGNVEVTDVVREEDCVRVEFTDRSDGETESVRAEYVLGCDGANSLVRSRIGAHMRDLRFQQRWLVVDIASTAELPHWDGVHQICDPVRAATYMRIGKTRYRWEFRLHAGESADDYRDVATLRPLLDPWLGETGYEQMELVRVAEYTFRAQLANRWRQGRVFLLGDAAHLTPPFIGQGMGAGIRDAANLSWKLAGVLRDELPAAVLDTYERERKPHARKMIRLAELTGLTMTAGGEVGNRVRGLIAPHLHHIPGFARMVTSGESPPLRNSSVVTPRVTRDRLAGRLIPNDRLDDGQRIDDIVGGRYAVITLELPTTSDRAAIRRRGGVIVCPAPDSELSRWMRRGRASTLVVRPDATVRDGRGSLSALCASLPDFAPSVRR